MRHKRLLWVSSLALLSALALAGQPAFAKQGDAPLTITSFSGAYLAARIAEGDNDLDNAIAYYKQALAFAPDDTSRTTEDSWQRAVEFLFERLAVRWIISDVPTEGQRELLARYRVASQDERRFVRDTLRTHLTEHFPDVEAP